MDSDDLHKVRALYGEDSDEYRTALRRYLGARDTIPSFDPAAPYEEAVKEATEELKAAFEAEAPKMSGESRSALDDLLRVASIKPKRGRYRAPVSTEEFVSLAERLKREEADRKARDKARTEYERESEAYYEKLRREREELERDRAKARAEAERLRAEEAREEREAEEMRERAMHQPTSFVATTYGEVATIAMNPAKACIVLRAQLSREFVSALNSSIAIKHRWWNGQDQVFEFHASVMPALKVLLKQFYADTQVMGAARPIPGTKFDKLMVKLSSKDKSDIYRLLASRYHPDRGGDHEVMSLINQVFKEK